jgi:hypothetical protein
VTTVGLACSSAFVRRLPLTQSVTSSAAATTLSTTEIQAHSVLAVVSAAMSSPKAASTSARTM